MGERRIEYMLVDDLVEAPTNAKRHASELIGQSVGRFGLIEQITLDERTGRIISGHGRRDEILNRRDADGEPPEGVVLAEDGSWRVPVVRGWASRDDAEAEAAGIALNRIGEAGGWDDNNLAGSLARLAELDDGLLGVGFTQDDLTDLLGLLAPPPSLDDLARQLGDPDPHDFWPVLRLRCAPEVRTRFVALVGSLPDDEQLAALVELAERAAVDAA